MNHRDIHIEDGEAAAFVAGGEPASPSAQSRRTGAEILEFQTHRRPRDLDASGPVDCFEPIGLLAVKLVAEWSLPRIRVEKTLP